MPKNVKILGVPFHKVTLKEATAFAIKSAKGKKQTHIATPNPEILLEAQKNAKFRKILNQTALNIPDGIGILWAAEYQNAKHKKQYQKYLKWVGSLLSTAIYPDSIRKIFTERVTGTDLMQEICKQAAKENLKIFLLGANRKTSMKLKEKLQKKYKNLKISGNYSGTPQKKDENKIIQKINDSKGEILFVAYGAPAQELWINRNMKKLKTVKLAMGVGGAFNFIAGTRKRAPKTMQKLGLEWLFRLIQEPKRIKRIYNATVKFPITVLTSSLKKE